MWIKNIKGLVCIAIPLSTADFFVMEATEKSTRPRVHLLTAPTNLVFLVINESCRYTEQALKLTQTVIRLSKTKSLLFVDKAFDATGSPE
jgi:hypothetical protein